jgi:TPP-dependent 2-oxoacid decarboxylase
VWLRESEPGYAACWVGVVVAAEVVAVVSLCDVVLPVGVLVGVGADDA